MTTRLLPISLRSYLRSLVLRLVSSRNAAETFVRSDDFVKSGADDFPGVDGCKAGRAEIQWKLLDYCHLDNPGHPQNPVSLHRTDGDGS